MSQKSEKATLRALVAEDEALMREGTVGVLERGGIEVVAVAVDREELERKGRILRPDVVITDIRMPPTQTDEGLRAALQLRAELPDTAVVVLSQHVQRRLAQELLTGAGRGGVGYLLKQRVIDGDRFCADVRLVGAGGSILDPEIVADGIMRAPEDALASLTEPQREVLAMMAEGLSNGAIANRLVLSEKAVGKRVSSIYKALGLPPDPDDHRRVLAVIRHLRSQS